MGARQLLTRSPKARRAEGLRALRAGSLALTPPAGSICTPRLPEGATTQFRWISLRRLFRPSERRSRASASELRLS